MYTRKNIGGIVAKLTDTCRSVGCRAVGLSVGFFRLRELRRIRRSLDSVSAVRLVHALVSSRVDYCNAVFGGLRRLLQT